MKRGAKLFIQDILECIEATEKFTKDISFREFTKDDKTSSAVVRKIEIIGEAVKNLPKSITDKYEKVPWSSMAKMRDKICHFYFGIDYEIVWKVIKENLPRLKDDVKKVLSDFDK